MNLRAAQSSLVLVQDPRKLLPLDSKLGLHIAMIGPHANASMALIQHDTGAVCPGAGANLHWDGGHSQTMFATLGLLLKRLSFAFLRSGHVSVPYIYLKSKFRIRTGQALALRKILSGTDRGKRFHSDGLSQIAAIQFDCQVRLRALALPRGGCAQQPTRQRQDNVHTGLRRHGQRGR